MPSPEQQARQTIDQLLTAAGWVVQDFKAADLNVARGVALREFELNPGHGTADYLLYVDGKAAGIIEAKKKGATLTGVEAQSARYAQGLEPEVRKCIDYDGEAHAVAEWLQGRHRAGYTWPQMAVLYPEHHIGDRIAAACARLGIPVDVAKVNRNRITVSTPAVRLMTMHTAKGLEFPCVAVAGLGALGRHGTGIEDDVRLAYVAITRATHEAFLTYSRTSPLVERLVA